MMREKAHQDLQRVAKKAGLWSNTDETPYYEFVAYFLHNMDNIPKATLTNTMLYIMTYFKRFYFMVLEWAFGRGTSKKIPCEWTSRKTDILMIRRNE
jgi:hypothetical protein